MARQKTAASRAAFLTVGVVATLIGVGAYLLDPLRAPELGTLDARYALRGEREAPKDIVVVAIDDVTFDELRLQWPFPRSVHGELIDRLAEDGAAQIAYDVQFTEPSTRREDNALLRAVGRAGGVVLATDEVDEGGGSDVLGGDEVAASLGARAGHTGLLLDPGGVVRRTARSLDGLASFSATVADPEASAAASDPGDRGELVDWVGGPGSFVTVSFSRALDPDWRPGYFAEKTVIIGASAPTLQDVHATAVSGEEKMSGPEIQAHMVQSARADYPLKDSPPWIDLALIMLAGLAAPVASIRLRPARRDRRA